MKQTEKKKKAILEVTFRLLNERESKNITVDEIAEKAEVSKVTLFKYYQSKNHLMNLTCQRVFKEMAEDIEAVFEANLSFVDSFAKISKVKIEHLERYSPVFRENLMAQYAESPDFFDLDTLNIQMTFFDRLFEKGKKEGKIAPEFTKEDFLFIFNIFTEGMKGLDTKSLIEKTTIINRFFLKGFS